ncbi:MAG: hypothetical protein ABI600_05350 [Luteolibacter sp.]
MKRSGVVWFGVLLGMISLLHAEEAIQNPGDDEWDKEVKAAGKAAEQDFEVWKSTGKVPEEFTDHVIQGAREDLVQRMISGDKLQETEIKTDLPTTTFEVSIHATAPMDSALKEGDSYRTVWRRITKDRFEIWTPKSGKLYDAKGILLAEAKVHRGDGWGREWYGAFLPDGRWITTDIDEFDKEVTAFSVKGKQQWSVKGATLIPKSKDPDAEDSMPLIAWARADKNGKAWIVSIGSERGRGFVKLTPDGKWTKIDDPWKECFPQQLRSRGMYIDRFTRSDDGSLIVSRTEASHGMFVGWPHYHFPKNDLLIPNGDDFGILPDSWAVFIESDCGPFTEAPEDRKDGRVWFFDANGTYQHWIKGRTVGASLPTGGLWIRQLDDSCALVAKGHIVKSRVKFSTKEKKSLIPVELHDDIGLGLFLSGDKLVLGIWE